MNFRAFYTVLTVYCTYLSVCRFIHRLHLVSGVTCRHSGVRHQFFLSNFPGVRIVVITDIRSPSFSVNQHHVKFHLLESIWSLTFSQGGETDTTGAVFGVILQEMLREGRNQAVAASKVCIRAIVTIFLTNLSVQNNLLLTRGALSVQNG